MAKKRSRPPGRDASDIARDPASLLGEPPQSVSAPHWSRWLTPWSDLHRDPFQLRDVEDRRTWYPSPYPTDWMPARRLGGLPARLEYSPPRKNRSTARPGAFPGPSIRFQSPREVVVCAKRKTRREVLAARGRFGRKTRPPRRSIYSSIHCTR